MLHNAYEQFVTVAEVQAAENCGCIDELSEDQISNLIDEASDLLALASGYRVAGRRDLIARPCRDDYDCSCLCGCTLDGIPLGENTPEVDMVKIDGEVLDPSLYQLHPTMIGWSLVRVHALQTQPPKWPSTQKLWLDDTEDNTFAVYFSEGFDVDRFVVTQAALELVCDFAAESRFAVDELEEGITSARLGGTTVTVDPDRLERLRLGGYGPATSRMMALFANAGRGEFTVWAPGMTGWSLNLRLPEPAGS